MDITEQANADAVKEGLKNKLNGLRKRNKKEAETLIALHKAQEAELEAEINPPRPVQPLVFGDINYSGHSYQDGLAIKGTLSISPPGVTKEGVFIAAEAKNGNISRDGFSFTKVNPVIGPVTNPPTGVQSPPPTVIPPKHGP